jgi:hypothetical protein
VVVLGGSAPATFQRGIPARPHSTDTSGINRKRHSRRGPGAPLELLAARSARFARIRPPFPIADNGLFPSAAVGYRFAPCRVGGAGPSRPAVPDARSVTVCRTHVRESAPSLPTAPAGNLGS